MGMCLFAPVHPDSLGTAEVTAARRVAGIATAVPVQRIDSADIVQRGITDMGDALRRFSGVNLRDYGGAGGLKTVSVRGLGAGHTAVTYDGLSVNDTRQGQIDLGQFSIDRLGSIELQTLEGGSLLCPVRNAAAAVVSLQTPWGNAPDKRWHGTATLRQASFGTYAPSVFVSKKVARRTQVNASADYFFAHNDYPFVVENGAATQHLRRTNSRMQTATAEGNLHHTYGTDRRGGEIDAKIYFAHNYRHLPGMVLYYVNKNNERLLEQNAFAQMQWRERVGAFRLFAAAKYNWQTSQYDNYDKQYPGGVNSQHYWQRETYATAGASYDILPCLQAAYATDFAYASLNSNLSVDRRADRHTWLQSLTLGYHTGRMQLTARGIWHQYWNGMEGGGSARDAKRLTPSVTASVTAVRSPFLLTVRAGYKEAFRMPTFTESYYYHYGSKTLLPELTRQLSAGLTLQARPARWWETIALTADIYRNRVSDRIVSIPYNLFVWKTVNMGDVRTLGLDLTLQNKWQPARKHHLLLALNYSWQQCRDYTSPTESSWHKQLAYTPLHSGAGSLTWLNPWLSLVVHTAFASTRWSTNNHLPTTSLSAYEEWGMAAFRRFKLTKDIEAEVRADLVNAFNTHYEVIRRYPMPGRSYKVNAKIEF